MDLCPEPAPYIWAFPAYVNFPVLEWLFLQLGSRWVNLYRDTDAIAGPVLSWGHSPDSIAAQAQSYRILQREMRHSDEIHPRTGRRTCGPEWRLLDPTPYDQQLQERAVDAIRAHSCYPDDPEWPAALQAVWPPARAAAGPDVPESGPPGSGPAEPGPPGSGPSEPG